MGVPSLRGYLIILSVLAVALMASAALAVDIAPCPAPQCAPTTTVPCPAPCPVTPAVSVSPIDQNMEAFQTNLLSSSLNVPQASITNWRNRGFTFGQIAMAANIANRANVSLDEVMARLQNGEGWSTIASAYNLNIADISNVTGRVAMAPEVMQLNTAFLMRHYGLSQSDISNFQARGFSLGDIALAANIASRSGRSVSSVLDMVASGMSWTQIANQLGISPTLAVTPTQQFMTASERQLMRSLLSRDFGLTGAQVDQLVSRGYSFNEIAMIGNLSARSGRDPIEIADLRDQGMSWTQIAQNVGVTVAALSNPYQRTITPSRPAAGRRLPRTGK